jgi:tetratricopeptide (TPR) repeat protein
VNDVGARIIGAQAELSLEHTASAVSAAREALDLIVRSPLRDRYQALEANAALALGRALEHSGDFAQARPNLERALRLREDNAESGSPWVGEAEVALANCLLDLGDRIRARSLFDKAAAAFASHREVGTQFKGAADALALRFAQAR